MIKEVTATFYFDDDKPVHLGFYRTLIVEHTKDGDTTVEIRTPTISYWNGERFLGAFGLDNDENAIWNSGYPIDDYALQGVYDHIPVEVITWTGVVK